MTDCIDDLLRGIQDTCILCTIRTRTTAKPEMACTSSSDFELPFHHPIVKVLNSVIMYNTAQFDYEYRQYCILRKM